MSVVVEGTASLGTTSLACAAGGERSARNRARSVASCGGITISSSLLDQPRSVTPRVTDIAAFLSALRHMIPSIEPAVVFTSLASICAPALADECLVLVEEDGNTTYQISQPLPAARTAPDGVPDWSAASDRTGPDRTEQEITEHWISTPILALPASEELNYRGVLVHRWHHGYHPTPTDAALAQVAVDRAVALISQERSADRLHTAELRTAHLQIGLETNREIGAAIGILMATHRLSQAQAFDQLRTASQHSHCKLREIADSVVFTGSLDPDLLLPGSHHPSISSTAPGEPAVGARSL